MTDDARPVAMAVGATAIASAASLAGLFTVGQPFGTLNDALNAGIGIGSAALALKLRPHGGRASGAAVAGGALVACGSALVISGTTKFFMAGHVSSVGFALIGGWLAAANRSMAAEATRSPRLTTLGTITGALMVTGLAAAPGIVVGVDEIETAPAWIWVGYLAWIGAYALYPAWAIWFGRERRAS